MTDTIVSAPEAAPKKKTSGTSTSKQAKAGLTFAVSRVDKKLRQAKIAKQVGGKASVHLTAVVEHVILKILKEAGAQASFRKSKRVGDAHILAAVRSDPDVARAFSGFCFTSAENVPKAIDRVLPEDEQKERKLRKAEAAERKAAAAGGREAEDAVED